MKLNIVTARTGLQWVRLGIGTFMRQPLALAGLFFLYMAAVVLLAQIPVAGPIIAGVLVPVATLGLMAATAEAAKGRFPMPWVLLTGLRAGRQQARAMLILGLVYTAGSMIATSLVALLIDQPAVSTASPIVADIDATSLLMALALHLPLALLFWHAPALVHWHGVTPAKSLFFSLVACLRNLGAFTVFGLAWLVVFLAAGTLFGWVGSLMGGPTTALAVMTPVALVMTAMFSTSIYFTFRDSFVASADDHQQPDGDSG